MAACVVRSARRSALAVVFGRRSLTRGNELLDMIQHVAMIEGLFDDRIFAAHLAGFFHGLYQRRGQENLYRRMTVPQPARKAEATLFVVVDVGKNDIDAVVGIAKMGSGFVIARRDEHTEFAVAKVLRQRMPNQDV